MTPKNEADPVHSPDPALRAGAAVGRRVRTALGPAGATRRLQVRPLWEGHYRVNVYSDGDPSTARIEVSYFVEVDGAGNLVRSVPDLGRRP